MELIEKRATKDHKARKIFASLLAIYCLLAVFTSFPLKKTTHFVNSEPSNLLAGAPKHRILPDRKPITSAGATVRDEWWRDHHELAELREKWWQRHWPDENEPAKPIELAIAPALPRTAKIASLPVAPHEKSAPVSQLVIEDEPRLFLRTAMRQADDQALSSQAEARFEQLGPLKQLANLIEDEPRLFLQTAMRQADDQALSSEAEARFEQLGPLKQLPKLAAKPVRIADKTERIETNLPETPLPKTPQEIGAPKPELKKVVLASFVPLKFTRVRTPEKPAYSRQKEQTPPAPINSGLKTALHAVSPPPVYNHCVEGKIAGWSGVTLSQKHKELLARSSSLEPQKVSHALAMRLAAGGFDAGSSVFMRIFKDKSQLQVWLKKDEKYALFHTYQICRWSGSFGPKLYEGDKQSPEGFYQVNRQLFTRPSWKWKGSFSIGYPNAYDKLHGRTGSLILVHGGCTSSGCFAMTNPVIQEVHELAQLARENGQDSFSVNVYPFKLTSANLKKHRNSPWMPFWQNMKTGYDLFEQTGLPPQVRVCNKRYVFAKADEERAGAGWSGKGCYGLAAYIPGWKQARRVASRGRGISRRGKRVRCNSRRASCRKFVSLKRRKAVSKRRKSAKRHAKRRAKRHRVARKTSARRRATMRRARAIGRKRK